MVAEGIVFDIPFDMSAYTREEILSRFSPYKDTSTWERERVDVTADNIRIDMDRDVIKTEDMVIKRFHPDKIGTLANLYLTTGILDKACPKLCRVDMLDTGYLLLSYPYFPEDQDYSRKIEWAVEEVERVSLFILDMVGSNNLEKWKDGIITYAQTYLTFVDRENFKGIGNKKIVKRIYKKVLDI